MKNTKIEIDVNRSYTVLCKKCKSVEDTFAENEKPEDFGWVFHRNKWYCAPCSHSFHNGCEHNYKHNSKFSAETK